MTVTANLLQWPEAPGTAEVTDTLLRCGGVRIERILSTGQTSPTDFWYDQDEDEWVSVLQGSAALQWDDCSITELAAGDWVLIPAHKKHRVERTSSAPPCIWLVMFLPPALKGVLCL